MLQISVSELKANPSKYVAMAGDQDVFITKNGKVAAKITNAEVDRVALMESLFGILPGDVDLDRSREERFQ